MSGPTGPLERVRASFGEQGLMRLLGVRVVEAGEGYCTIELPFSEGVTQQKRYFHGAAIGAVGDNAGGYAALTLAPPDREVLTVEYKVNFLAPARGERRRSAVTTSPRATSLFVCKAEVSAVTGGRGDTLRSRVADRLALSGTGLIWRASGGPVMRPVAWASGSINV
ncbi:MAG TPA: PaaI family thioesterase [Rubrobacter sp.]|nr:PaaI family thioesterase [Rubrobacter sp.]